MQPSKFESVMNGLSMIADSKNDYVCEGLKCSEIANGAIELLKKKLPQKVENIRTFATGLVIADCPTCGNQLTEEYPKYGNPKEIYPKFCGICGQPIKWKDGD